MKNHENQWQKRDQTEKLNAKIFLQNEDYGSRLWNCFVGPSLSCSWNENLELSGVSALYEKVDCSLHHLDNILVRFHEVATRFRQLC